MTFEPDPSDRLASAQYRSAVEEYMDAEVLPYVSDAWVDHTKTKVGYEIPVPRHFYKHVPPRPLEEIDAEIIDTQDELQLALARTTGDSAAHHNSGFLHRRRGSSSVISHLA